MALYYLVIFCIIIVALLIKLLLLIKFKIAWCRSKTCLVGKTAVITGSNTGIGYETALDFAKRGARVILACRNQAKAEIAREKIISETGNRNIVVKLVDLSSFDSIRNFAKDINETEHRLDILVNNAGAGGIGNRRSKDGQLLLMQINYYSGFLLTNLLLDLLKKSTPSRIVNVSSLAAKYSNFCIENIDHFPGLYYIYANSKLCQILFTMELAKRLEGSGVTVYSVHPGVVKTEIFRRINGKSKFIFDLAKDLFFKTSEEGAQTTIFTAVAKGIEKYSGGHFDNCKKIESYSSALIPGLPQKLWEKTEQIVQVNYK